MGTPEITLNGMDWSNLYHIDYHGGCGGELLMGIASIPSPYIKINNNKGNDSTFGIMAVGNIPNNISISHIPERNVHNLNDDEYRYVVKSLLNIRTTTDWADRETYVIDPIKNIRDSNENFLIRTHDHTRDYSSLFHNCKSLRLYSPIDNWHLIMYMMFKKQFLLRFSGNLTIYTTSSHKRDIASKYMSTRKFLRTWEWMAMVQFNEYLTFDEFLSRRFTSKTAVHEQFKESINAANWVFDINTKDIIEQIQDTYKTIISEEKKEAISNWQQKNISMLTDNGLSLSSTPNDIQTKLIEECIQLK